jgi:hypothetical protein
MRWDDASRLSYVLAAMVRGCSARRLAVQIGKRWKTRPFNWGRSLEEKLPRGVYSSMDGCTWAASTTSDGEYGGALAIPPRQTKRAVARAMLRSHPPSLPSSRYLDFPI